MECEMNEWMSEWLDYSPDNQETMFIYMTISTSVQD